MPTCSSCGESAPFHELSNFSVPSTEKCKRLCFKCVEKEWTQSVADHIERDFAVLHVKRALGLDETDLKGLDDVESSIEQLKSNNQELVSSTLRLKHDLEFRLNAAQQELERVKAQNAKLVEELKFWAGFVPKHEGDCEFSDKVDEGCYLCAKATNVRFPQTNSVMQHAKELGL